MWALVAGGRRHGLNLSNIKELRGIIASETSVAVGNLLVFTAGVVHSFQREIRERVGADELPNLFDRFVGGDKFLAPRSVNTVVAGGDRRRTRDAHVHFGCAGLANHANNF